MANALSTGTGSVRQQTGRRQTGRSQTGRPQTVARPTDQPPARQRKLELDGSRITASAGAIALNAIVMLLLLSPVATPPLPLPLPAQRDPEITWVRPRIEPWPIVLPVARKPQAPQSATAPQPRIAAPQVDRPLPDSQPDDLAVAPTDQVVDRIVEADPGDTIAPMPSLAASTQLQPLSAPPPAYPPAAVRSGLSGTVELEILVGVDGKPLQATVVRSSGHRALDQAARKVVLAHWRFAPAIRGGQAVQALGRVPIVFTLER